MADGANLTRREVQRILRDNILAGLAAFGIEASGFSVMEAGQTPPTSKGDVILFKLEGSKPLGWQSAKFRADGASVRRVDEALDNQEWLVSVLRRRRTGDSASTPQSEDVARSLAMWFNGRGCAFFRRHGMANTNVRETPVTLMKSSSSAFERSSSFRLNLQVPRSAGSGADVAALVYGGNAPI